MFCFQKKIISEYIRNQVKWFASLSLITDIFIKKFGVVIFRLLQLLGEIGNRWTAIGKHTAVSNCDQTEFHQSRWRSSSSSCLFKSLKAFFCSDQVSYHMLVSWLSLKLSHSICYHVLIAKCGIGVHYNSLKYQIWDRQKAAFRWRKMDVRERSEHQSDNTTVVVPSIRTSK